MKAQLDYDLCTPWTQSCLSVSETQFTIQVCKYNMGIMMINVPQKGPGEAAKKDSFLNYN